MEAIVTEIAGNFIKNLLEMVTSGEKSFAELENAALLEAKSCAAKIMGAYAEAVDCAILEDKAGRRELGCTVERKSDERSLQTLVGEVSYRRTYYKKASGGYEYLADTALGINSRERVSTGLSLALANAAKDMSYGKASNHISGGEISRQTVMGRVRRSRTAQKTVERQRVPELHIDADEAHVTLCHGRKSEVPLISVYEGIDHNGKRNCCKNIFHISEYGKKPDELWEQALTAGFTNADRKAYDREIRWALDNADCRFFDELTDSICGQMTEREEKIRECAGYLRRFADGISVCKTDPCANNGGCTEPHVSHVLAARLSSRPMAWSPSTLQKLVPILAAGRVDTVRGAEDAAALPKPLRKAASSARKAFRRGAAGLPNPSAIGKLPLSGKITGTQKILKLFL